MQEQVGDQGRPPGLVRSPQAPAVLAVEVLVEGHEVAPGRVVPQQRLLTEDRPVAGGVGQEQRGQPVGQLVGDGREGELPAGAAGMLAARSSPKNRVLGQGPQTGPEQPGATDEAGDYSPG